MAGNDGKTESVQMEELKAASSYARSLIEASLDPLVTIGRDGKITDVNEAMEKATGIPRERLIGSDFSDYFAEPEEARASYRQAFSEGLVRDYPLTIRHTSGKTIDVLYNATVYRDEAGEVQGAFAAARDITEHKRAEEALKASEIQYRRLFETARDGILILDAGTGLIIDVNPFLIESLGFSREELLGKEIWELGFLRDVIASKDAFAELQQRGYVRYEDIPLKTATGRRLDVEFVSNVYKVDRRKVIQCNIRDITKHKRIEKELILRGQILAKLAEGVSIIRLSDLVIVYSNPKFDEMFGYDRDELIGQRINALNAPGKPGPEEVVEEILKYLKESNEWHGEIHHVRKDGTLFWCQVSITTFEHTVHGKVAVSIHEDITERKQMEEQLIIADRLASIGELASGIAHEINNPLTGIIGLSELVLDADVPAEVRNDLETINSEARRTAAIVHGLLTFARKHSQEKQPADINEIISQVLQLRAYEQKVNNINVVTQFAPKLPEIMADGLQLQQVFINIIVNSEYFMTEAHGRGTLTISTERVDDIVRISFVDDGPGISEENLEHVFDPFFTTKEVGRGTGLGLSICHGIVTGYGGRIYAESESGQGATFIVELPIVATENEGDASESN
jgi:PAS domain S-box-containing protein